MLVAIVGLLSSCVSSPKVGQQVSGLSPKASALVQDAVFEVIVKKATKDSLTYNKPLDWDVVPYAIRMDKYYSIGTAFAVNNTELVTAFHVIDLGEASAVYDAYYVRDSRGEVYEVDSIVRGSKERDFLVFTVKNRVFETFFEFEKNFTVGSPVYSVGNAFGEGIVVRNGLVLGTIPEQESGRWNKLKSSADGNPGNSGGPLMTPEGTVIGVVIELTDNILYSLPTAALLETPADKLLFRQKLSYGHLFLSNRITKVYETEVALPANYKSIRKAITERYEVEYDTCMKELFKEAPAYLDGPNNAHLLSSVVNSSFPELAFVDKDDNNWKLSDLSVERFNLPDDGAVIQAKVGGYSLLKVDLPKNVSLDSVLTNPKALMDLILKGAALERGLGGAEKYRILSFGSPVDIGEYRDMLGRLWIKARWTIEYSDRALIAFILPLPNGPAVVLTEQPTSQITAYDWDMKALCDRVQVAYKGELPEWTRFLAMKKWIPEFLSDFSFEWSEKEKRFSIKSSAFAITSGADVLDWTSLSSFSISPAHYLEDGKLQFGLRKVLAQRDVRGRDFFILYKNMKPDIRLGAKSAEEWDALVKERTPFDSKPGIDKKKNLGSMGAILTQAIPSSEALFSLYFTMEEPENEDELLERFSILKAGIQVKR